MKIALIFFLFTSVSAIQAKIFYKEANLLGGYSDNDKLVSKKNMMAKSSVGFEYFQKLSDDYGDFLTLNLQTRFTYDFDVTQGKSYGTEIHNGWGEYRLGLGKSLKVGHFDPEFGLEPALDTHGSLLQTNANKTIGFKKDWGVGYRSYFGKFDLGMAAQIGSGMTPRYEDGNYLLSSRISNPIGEENQYGLSLFYGNILKNKRSAQERWQLGLDLQRPLEILDFRSEISVGAVESDLAGGALLELSYLLPKLQKLRFKIQGQYWNEQWEVDNREDLTIAAVSELKIHESFIIRLGYFHDLKSRIRRDRLLLLQLYYYE